MRFARRINAEFNRNRESVYECLRDARIESFIIHNDESVIWKPNPLCQLWCRVWLLLIVATRD